MNYYHDLSKGSGSHSSAKMDFFHNRFNTPFGLQDHVQLTSLDRVKNRPDMMTIRNSPEQNFSLGYDRDGRGRRHRRMK